VYKDSEGILPLQSGTNKFATQSSSQVTLGATRNQVTRVIGRLKRHGSTDHFIPFQSGKCQPLNQSRYKKSYDILGTNSFASQAGMKDAPGVGAFRQVTMECENLNLSEEAQRTSSIFTPWLAGSNKFASQSGTGGFLVAYFSTVHIIYI